MAQRSMEEKAKKVSPKLSATPVRKRQQKMRAEHSPSEVHRRLADHSRLNSEMCAKNCAAASLDCRIMSNLERYRIRWTPIEKKFSRMLAPL